MEGSRSKMKVQIKKPLPEKKVGAYEIKTTDVVENVEEGFGIFLTMKINGKVYVELLDAELRGRLCTLEDVIESTKKIPSEL